MNKKTIITVLLTLLAMSAACQGTGATVDSTPFCLKHLNVIKACVISYVAQAFFCWESAKRSFESWKWYVTPSMVKCILHSSFFTLHSYSPRFCFFYVSQHVCRVKFCC